MPLVQSLLLNIPTTLLGILIIGGTIGLSILGLLIVRKYVPAKKFKAHNDVAGFIFATLGVIYAVMLAFLVIVAWENFDQCNSNVVKEANFIGSLYRDSEAFSPDFKAELSTALNAYVNSIIHDEWPLLSKGRGSPRTHQLSTNIYKLYAKYEPRSISEQIFLAESIGKRNDAGELKRIRIHDSHTGIHPVLWLVLIMGGMITISFTFFFGMENFGAQIIMTSLLAGMIGLMLFTVMVLDYPYSGSVSIHPGPFIDMIGPLGKIK
ncbi:MAG: hypothetical protein V1843_00485 [bacterium]